MAKNNRPQAANPLAGMGLEDIVCSMTSAEAASTETEENIVEAEAVTNEKDEKAAPKRRRGSLKAFEEKLNQL